MEDSNRPSLRTGDAEMAIANGQLEQRPARSQSSSAAATVRCMAQVYITTRCLGEQRGGISRRIAVEVAPHRMNMVPGVLRVVELDQERGALDAPMTHGPLHMLSGRHPEECLAPQT